MLEKKAMASNLIAEESTSSADSDARPHPVDREDPYPDTHPATRYREHNGCTTSRTSTDTRRRGQYECDHLDMENQHHILSSNHEDSHGSRVYQDIGPDEFEAMLSRSLPSAAGGLGLGLAPEPEPVVHHIRNRTRRGSVGSAATARTLGSNSTRASSSSSSPEEESNQQAYNTMDDDDLDQGQDQVRPIPVDEETPLLLQEAPNAPSSSSGSSTYCLTSDHHPKSSSDEPQSPYLCGVSPARFWVLFLGVMTVHFVSWFDSTIMASSHPIITSYFDASNSASWLSTAFLLTSTSFQPFVGGLSDAIGRKTPYIISVVVFIVATVWCALATSMTSFIVARAVCGLGAGGTIALANIMVGDLVPIENRGTFQSWINVVFGVGSMSGAALGGLMADYLGWRWEFGVQVPLLLAGLGVTALTIPGGLGLDGRDGRGMGLREAMRGFDYAGSVLLSLSITFLILGLSLGGNVLPWSDPYVISSLACFAVFFPLFLHVETKAVKPIMPLRLVRLSPHRNLLLGNAIAAMISSTVLFNVPLFFQGVLLSSATTSGLRLLTCSLVSSSAGAATGLLITSTRRLKWPLVTGTTLIIFGTLCLSSLQRSWPSWTYVLVLIPTHSGMGFQYTATSVSILAVPDPTLDSPAAPEESPTNNPKLLLLQNQKRKSPPAARAPKAVITSTLILVRSLGMVLGVSLSSLIVQNSLWYFLDINVQGPPGIKEYVINEVRRSVEAIRDLDPVYQEQVVQSYESALRVCFAACVGLAVVSWFVILRVELPRLRRRT
ncbi:putative transporter C460.03-like protein 1 [Rhypophila decipiens]